MAKRKSISKRVRFEVFKRDSFKCQYCGRSAPDVTLQIEHVLPVAKGGDNDMMNLLSACVECNAGKSDVLLDDNAAVQKQKRQADELNERRVQLEMMMQWKRELLRMNDDSLDQVNDYWHEQTGTHFSPTGREEMRKTIRTFGLAEILECIDLAVSQYSDHAVAFKKVGAIANVRRKSKDDPDYQTVAIIRGILAKSLSYVNYRELDSLVRGAIARGMTKDQAIRSAREARSWTRFSDALSDFGRG